MAFYSTLYVQSAIHIDFSCTYDCLNYCKSDSGSQVGYSGNEFRDDRINDFLAYYYKINPQQRRRYSPVL